MLLSKPTQRDLEISVDTTCYIYIWCYVVWSEVVITPYIVAEGNVSCNLAHNFVTPLETGCTSYCLVWL